MNGRGFTLFELLVAVAIFAVLSALAYGGYNTSARQSAIAAEHMARLKAVQNTIRLMTQDFEQLAPRPVRDLLGDSWLPALESESDGEVLVMLTRNGWTNPAGLPRSTLQRVRYVLEDQALRREYWTVLDATLSNEPVRRELLSGVRAVEIRYMHENRQWQAQWPPLGMPPPMTSRSRPIAVQVRLTLEDFGEIERVVEVGG